MKKVKTLLYSGAFLAGLVGLMPGKVQAATIGNGQVYQVTSVSQTVYNNYEHGFATGQILRHGTNWKIIRRARDDQGRLWYDLGRNQWVRADEKAVDNTAVEQMSANQTQASVKIKQPTVAKQVANDNYANSANNQAVSNTYYQSAYNNYQTVQKTSTVNKVNNQAPQQTQPQQTRVASYQKPQYATNLPNSEQRAKAAIAQVESGNDYTATNGHYIGKYQLDTKYLHGDYSPRNQEHTADQYVRQRYGNWQNALKFRQRNNWY